MTTVRLLALIFLIVARSAAQDRTRNEMPSNVGSEINPGGSTLTSAAPLSLPDAPTRQRVIDKKFITVMGTLGAAESLRFTTRKLVLDREFAAGAPWVSSVPSDQHLVAMYAGLYAAELLVTYEIKKPHHWFPGDKVIRRLWWAYPSAMVAIHIKNGVGNIRTQGPGGCTSVECAMQSQ